MTPIMIVFVVAASLFGTGTVVKDSNPRFGTALQGAGVGTLVGGSLGTLAGAGAFLHVAAPITAGAVIGGGVGAVGGGLVAKKR